MCVFAFRFRWDFWYVYIGAINSPIPRARLHNSCRSARASWRARKWPATVVHVADNLRWHLFVVRNTLTNTPRCCHATHSRLSGIKTLKHWVCTHMLTPHTHARMCVKVTHLIIADTFNKRCDTHGRYLKIICNLFKMYMWCLRPSVCDVCVAVRVIVYIFFRYLLHLLNCAHHTTRRWRHASVFGRYLWETLIGPRWRRTVICGGPIKFRVRSTCVRLRVHMCVCVDSLDERSSSSSTHTHIRTRRTRWRTNENSARERCALSSVIIFRRIRLTSTCENGRDLLV